LYLRNVQGYAFMTEHLPFLSVRAICHCLRLHLSGFYAWIKNPLSHRVQEDALQTKLLKETWEESGNIYGYLPDIVTRSI
jgi:putative transposase